MREQCKQKETKSKLFTRLLIANGKAKKAYFLFVWSFLNLVSSLLPIHPTALGDKGIPLSFLFSFLFTPILQLLNIHIIPLAMTINYRQ